MSVDTETLITSDGNAWLCRFEGVVVHADRRFETHVSSSGGGGYIGPSGGYLAEPQIRSTTTDHQTIFLRGSDGSEQSFDLQDWDLAVRPGSRMVVVWGARDGRSNGPFMGVRNLDTGETRLTDIPRWQLGQGLLAGKMRVWPSVLLAVLLGGAFMMVSFYAHGPATRGSENFNAFLLATGIAFAPIFVLEWIFCIVIRSTDGEHKRIRELLIEYLQTGKMSD